MDQMKPKFKPTTTGDDVSKAVADGEAQLGVLPLSEVLPVPGVELGGRFPTEVEDHSVMVGGVSATAGQSPAVKAFISFLTAGEIDSAIEKKGMERAR
jgi:molybdate transport system substrate-binding protein